MSVVSQAHAANVYVACDEPKLRNAIARVLSLDPEVRVLRAGAGRTPRQSDVVVSPALLEDVRDMTIGEFIDMVKELANEPDRHLHAVPDDGDMRALLSEREMQVVKLIAEGLSNKQISARLGLSDKTVKNHISHILAKLNLSARTQVAIHAIRAGIV